MELLSPDVMPPFLVGTFGRRSLRLGRGCVGRQQVALSADGETLWYFEGWKLVTASARDGRTQRVTTHPWTLSPDRIARTADDALLLVGHAGALWYDPRRDELLHALRFERSEAWAIATSPADPARGACVTLHHFATPCGYTFSRADGVARPLAFAPEDGSPRAVAFTPDGATIVVLCDRSLARFDAACGERLSPLLALDATQAAADALVALAVVDADTLVVVTLQGTLLALDLRTGAVRARASSARPLHALSVAPSSDGRVLTGHTGALHLYELPTLRDDGAIAGDFTLSADGDLVVDASRPVAWVVDARGALHRVDLAARTFEATPPASYPSALAWSGDALRVARYDSPVETLDLATGASSFDDLGQRACPEGFSDDGDALFVRVDSAGRWRSLRGGEPGPIVPSQGQLALTREGCWSLSPRGLEDGARVIPVARCKNARALAVSPSGHLALVAGTSEAIVVDLREGAEVARYKLAGGGFARFVSEAEAVVVGPRGARWIDVRTGAVLAHSKRATREHCAVSRDGRLLASAHSIEEVVLVTRDRPDDAVHFRAAWHPMVLAFSPDGSRLAVAGCESVLRVFDVAAALATRPAPRAKRR